MNHMILKFFLYAMAVGTFCVACSSRDDVEELHALIAKGAALTEARDIAGMMKLASDGVRAMPMDVDHNGIKGVLWRTFNYYGPIKVLYPRPIIEVHDELDEASAQFPFLIVKREQTIPSLEDLRDDPVAWLEKIGGTADLYRLRLQLTRQDGDWLVDRAFLEQFTGLGFEK